MTTIDFELDWVEYALRCYQEVLTCDLELLGAYRPLLAVVAVAGKLLRDILQVRLESVEVKEED